jgi:predicted TIM-barrel fold metal-dependent hydrolase
MGGDFVPGCRAIRDCPNVFTEPSGSYCERGMVEYAVKMLGADRILFGSDAPGADFLNNLAKVLACEISEPTKKKILFDNAARILG